MLGNFTEKFFPKISNQFYTNNKIIIEGNGVTIFYEVLWGLYENIYAWFQGKHAQNVLLWVESPTEPPPIQDYKSKYL